MGIWDFISGTTDSLKRNAPDLTAVNNWVPTPDSLKRIVPDGTAAKQLCSTAYGFGSATVTKIDSAVRGNLSYYLQEEEARSKIVRFGTILAKNTTHECLREGLKEGLKMVPGGSLAYYVVNRSLYDFNKSDKQEVDMKALQANLLRLEKEVSEYKKLHEQVQINKPCADFESPSTTNIHSVANQKPEDVIRVFMMKEFMHRQLFDDLLVLQVAPRKK